MRNRKLLYTSWQVTDRKENGQGTLLSMVTPISKLNLTQVLYTQYIVRLVPCKPVSLTTRKSSTLQTSWLVKLDRG